MQSMVPDGKIGSNCAISSRVIRWKNIFCLTHALRERSCLIGSIARPDRGLSCAGRNESGSIKIEFVICAVVVAQTNRVNSIANNLFITHKDTKNIADTKFTNNYQLSNIFYYICDKCRIISKKRHYENPIFTLSAASIKRN